METNTARNFALQLGALVSLYLSLTFLIVLLFGAINLAVPDAMDNYWQLDNYQTSIRFGVAFLIVFFPTYLVLTRTVNRIRRSESEGAYLVLTKWLIYLSLLIGGGVLLGDLVAVIMSFLEGELTTRFILKALTVLIVVGTAFYYYLQDARGVWIVNEQRSKLYGAGASAVVIAAIVFGFVQIDSPSVAREIELDQKQISDLQEIQYRVESHIVTNEYVPSNLNEVYDVGTPPTAPNGRPAYIYNRTDDGFELCAAFSEESTDRYASGSLTRPIMVDKDIVIKNGENWIYNRGQFCFQRFVELPEGTEAE